MGGRGSCGSLEIHRIRLVVLGLLEEGNALEAGGSGLARFGAAYGRNAAVVLVHGQIPDHIFPQDHVGPVSIALKVDPLLAVNGRLAHGEHMVAAQQDLDVSDHMQEGAIFAHAAEPLVVPHQVILDVVVVLP